MATFKSRVKRLEGEWRFRCWLRDQRFLESLTDEQLEVWVVTGPPPAPQAPEPPPGTSRLDKLERKSLLRLWQEHEREWMRRSDKELDFFTHHGHWPERACKNSDCQNRGRLAVKVQGIDPTKKTSAS
jgi:hypothetical protein